MSGKWNLPPQPLPSWLSPGLETTEGHRDMTPGDFTAECVCELLDCGVSITQAIEVCANTLNETGHGRYYRANNLGGWKITPGVGGKWWRAPGNRAPGATWAGHEGATVTNLKGGDPPWCYYRAFASFGEYFKQWLKLFVPKPGTVSQRHRYYKTGVAFWSEDSAVFSTWFRELCLAGYKGARTKKNPEGSIAEHRQLVAMARTRFAQKKLGVVPDGAWGPKSRAKCEEFQRLNELQVNGEITQEVLEKLAEHWLATHGEAL